MLLQGGIQVTEHDLDKNPLSNEEILTLVTKKPGEMRGPVVVFDDGTTVLGFNRDRLESLIKNDPSKAIFPLVGKKECSE